MLAGIKESDVPMACYYLHVTFCIWRSVLLDAACAMQRLIWQKLTCHTHVCNLFTICWQAVQVFEQAVKAQPTGRMFSLYASYLQDCLEQDTPQQPANAQPSVSQQATLHSLLQLYKRTHSAGPLYYRDQLTCESLMGIVLTVDSS